MRPTTGRRRNATPSSQTVLDRPEDTAPVELYGEGLADVMNAELGDGPWFLRYDDGELESLPLEGWCSPEIAGDGSLVARCAGPTLDVGCGPGRLAAAVGARSLPVLGLDISTTAVLIARRRGALVVQRSVFDPLPGEGGWRHVLLADGNIGIGGDPARLLKRCAELVSSEGNVLVELSPPGVSTRQRQVRIESATGRQSEEFAWAHLSVDVVGPIAAQAGLRVVESWSDAGRWFAAITR